MNSLWLLHWLSRSARRSGKFDWCSEGRHSEVNFRVAYTNESCSGGTQTIEGRGFEKEEVVMGPYSLDLRERVAAAIDQGESQRQVARRFGVSVRREKVSDFQG
jgi:hypothetical protein